MKKFYSLLLVMLLVAVCAYGAYTGSKDEVAVVEDTEFVEETEVVDAFVETGSSDDQETDIRSDASGRGLMDFDTMDGLEERIHKDRDEAEEDIEEEEIESEDTETEESEEMEEEETESETEEETETETESEIETETEEKSGKVKVIPASDKTFDYVALGNSVTCNVTSDLWWGNWGMAATTPKKDYVHLISQWLGGQCEQHVSTTVINLKNWEVAANRDSKVANYEPYFNEYTDLVTIQTGENITENKGALMTEYSNLLKMIKEKAPNAQVLMIGELLWPAEDIETAKKNACNERDVKFIEATDFLNGYETYYKSAMGVEVEGNDGSRHAIANETVAAHPNDEGMACIAQLFINHIIIKK